MTAAPGVTLEQLRQRVDSVDHGLLALLAERKRVVLEIARFKRDARLGAHQPDRGAAVLASRTALAAEKGLDVELVRSLFSAIMEASVEEQARAMAGLDRSG